MDDAHYDQWFEENYKAIQSRTAFLADLPQGVVNHRPKSMHQLRVERREDQLQLYFYGSDSAEVQSRMNVHNPLDLLSPYTQAMILALVWQPRPKRIYMVGFGAGRVPMIFHSYFPDVVIECTELDADVVEVTQTYFGVAFDRRLKVIIEDGRKYLERKSSSDAYDILFIDAFRGTGNSPFPLATKEFYEVCKRHLSSGGVIAVNLLLNDTLYHDKARTLAASFRNAYEVKTGGWGTAIIFATDGDSLSAAELAKRAEEVFEAHRFIFPFVEHAHKLRQISKNGVTDMQGHILSDAQPPDALPLPPSAYARIGRNDVCPCGSGKKFKKCHYLAKI